VFASSNPAEVDGFSQDEKFQSTNPPGLQAVGPESEFSVSLKNLKLEKIDLCAQEG
jgi:hypothetical protein